MKNRILMVHPFVGTITFEDVISYLKIMVKNSEMFEDIVYNLLQDTMNPEDLATLFNFSVINRLKLIIDILNDVL